MFIQTSNYGLVNMDYLAKIYVSGGTVYGTYCVDEPKDIAITSYYATEKEANRMYDKIITQLSKNSELIYA